MSIYAVNEKSPISAWIPSLDTAGNGTSTLTDLAGSNSGTLTNFALTGSSSNWVADTGSGGVRAIQYDGANDYVAISDSNIFNPLDDWSISAWVKFPSFGTTRNIFSMTNVGNNTPIFSFGLQNFTNLVSFYQRNDAGGVFEVSANTATISTDGSMMHFVVTRNSGVVTIWQNGVLQAATATPTGAVTLNRTTLGAWRRTAISAYSNQAHDDIRVFDQGFNASDVGYLFNSNNGRARVTASGALILGSSMNGGYSLEMDGGYSA